MHLKTLTNLFLDHIKLNDPSREIFYTKLKDNYYAFTITEFLQQVYMIVKFFNESKIQSGDKIAIFSESRTEWAVVDFACMFCKLISIPIYTSQSDAQIKYILENSGCQMCFVSNKLLLGKILNISDGLPALQKIITFNETSDDDQINKGVENFAQLIAIIARPDKNIIYNKLLDQSEKISENDLVTIIYTSGTTGIPKGVMLTHKNIYSNVKACEKVLAINERDVFLSYLPYSHIYERTAGYYLPLFCGAKIYYAQSIDTIAAQLTEVKPTFVITVPRLLDKIYYRLMKSGDEMKNGLKKKIFNWGIGITKDHKISKKNLKWIIADKIVYKKIRERTGGNIRYFVSGGGALNKAVGKFFDNIGITILEGYGMTETSPVISVNPPDKNKYGTVGKPLGGVKVKLTQENEILVQGDIVMKGYYNDEINTSEVLKDNWLYTGDIGEFDSDGYLMITDRKKSLIKTSGGKYVAPAQIEDLVGRLNYVENTLVIGNGRMYVSALIVPLHKDLEELAKKNKIEYNSYSVLILNKMLNELIQNDLDKIQEDLAPHERIRKFKLIEKPFSIETGELTPTMKIKRKFVEDKFKDDIESMYMKI
ncbi:MAG: long-chain fatty acid--CoA ligase [Ignavibacteria bacterium]